MTQSVTRVRGGTQRVHSATTLRVVLAASRPESVVPFAKPSRSSPRCTCHSRFSRPTIKTDDVLHVFDSSPPLSRRRIFSLSISLYPSPAPPTRSPSISHSYISVHRSPSRSDRSTLATGLLEIYSVRFIFFSTVHSFSFFFFFRPRRARRGWWWPAKTTCWMCCWTGWHR